MEPELAPDPDPDPDPDLNRFLMALAHLLGAWDRQMLIPWPYRPQLVEHIDGRWALDERGYPKPSRELLLECYYLRQLEAARKDPRD
jgi:hypothetical protein